MDKQPLSLKIQALIFASEVPLNVADIQNVFIHNEEDISKETIIDTIATIKNDFSSSEFAFELQEIGGGYQFLTKRKYFDLLSILNKDKFSKKLSTSSMETLAIIAYKQPVSKPDMEVIRGVNCDYAVQKLLDKELVCVIGRDENLPGKPLLYSTTQKFLDYLALNHLEDLPKVSEITPEASNMLDKVQKKLPSEDKN